MITLVKTKQRYKYTFEVGEIIPSPLIYELELLEGVVDVVVHPKNIKRFIVTTDRMIQEELIKTAEAFDALYNQ